MTSLPTVTVLVPVLDGEAFLTEALESALAQDYPADRLDVVVVDDGSSDASGAIANAVAARAPGRVQVLRQANGGTAAAINAARDVAGGELLALLDADDRWPADKLVRQVRALEAAPEAGLLYGDMTVVDAAGSVLSESWLETVWPGEPPAGRCFGALLAANPATASSILMRADLSRRLGPIPAELRCADWWLALSAARAGAVAYLPEPRTAYRLHGGNLGLGREGPALGRAHVRRATVQRCFLASVTAADAEPIELATAWNAFERNVAEALLQLGSPFATVVHVSAGDREHARGQAASAAAELQRGAAREAMASFVRALAADPWNAEAQDGLATAWERSQ
jgi:tetratricopeptide (TPR) repeat protein